ncbi:DNA polymerase III catalytic subunit DnaE type [Bacillus oleivorans]|uniref:DNA polymerase III subunit alpha n=1 Tax=Bacillus oleivorans TaxID=1448271 RepID=A0A285CWL0_9BACI|nr:DNA polymerase III subunit alpha [Bacillus oleivorans]SNX71426.1 DNA polymerase III catalytic subunit DnaE type [Bacillus oleivorans]
MSFVHLYVKSAYSLLQSSLSIESLVKEAKAKGYSAIALTDHHVMYGVFPFYKECLKQGIKPIIGLTVEVEQDHQQTRTVVLLAKSFTGYQSLVKISSAIQTQSSHRLPLKWLRAYNQEVIGILAELPVQTSNENQKKLDYKAITTVKNCFEPSSFFVGIRNEDLLIHANAVKECFSNQIECVAIQPVHYGNEEDAFVYRCLSAIRDGVKLSEQGDNLAWTEGRDLKSKAEMVELFEAYPNLLENSVRIASHCQIEFKEPTTRLPKYPVPAGQTSEDFLRDLCLEGLEKRGMHQNGTYHERLKYELNIIQELGFSDYFLIVWDFIKYSHENNILTGPGRGSAAGSLVSYVLFITDVDPLEHGLLFERFLNPERITMPDIDIDFPDHKREQVIDYVVKKYGRTRVAQIITFGTFAAKAALRDVARIFGLSGGELEQLSRWISSSSSLQEAFERSEALRKWVEAKPLHKKLFRTAQKIEGLPRHTSTHAAGVVMSEFPLTELVPLQGSLEEAYLTQYPMEILEELGLLKMDFLGLRNLTILEMILESIKQSSGKNLSLKEIPPNDPKTFQLLADGKTSGIFQLESDGMRSVLQRLKPTSFEDIVAVNALYRPGPMENIPTFIARKHGKEPIEFWHEDVEDILKPTYGVLVYQEQIMQVASEMAGFSLGEADLLRRAVGKKKKEVLDQEREHFVNGAIRKGYDTDTANQVYDLIVRFANYGFNKSHAVAYSLIAYQLSFLKTHYPLAFIAALLTSVIGNEDKTKQYITELKEMGYTIYPPSIHKSGYTYLVEKEGLRFPISAIKGVGAAAVREIFQVRKSKKIQDFFDLILHVSPKAVNRKTIECLIYAGALDEFKQTRATLLASIDSAYEYVSLVKPNEDEMDLFHEEAELLKPNYQVMEEMPVEAILDNEKRVLGLFLSHHPVSPLQTELVQLGIKPLAALKNGDHHVRVGVFVSGVRVIRTKKGEVMAFLTISDESGEMDAVLFPSAYKRYSGHVKEGNILLAIGNVDERAGKQQLIVNELYKKEEWDTIQNKLPTLFIHVLNKEQLWELKTILLKHKGSIPVILIYSNPKKTIRLKRDYWISPSSKALQEIKDLVGQEQVILKS